MPFTPVHLGPGAFFKGILGKHFSFVVFGGSQILMDLEPLIQMLRGSTNLHGTTHNLIGALVVGTIAALLGRPIGGLFLRAIQSPDQQILWQTSLLSAFIGTFSHVALDGIMHSDMWPWFPLIRGNNLLGYISTPELHVLCVVLGFIGVTIMAIRRLFSAKSY